MTTTTTLQTLTSLCRRRGFLFQSSEIYGGLASTWDYGPLGVELKNNVKRHWWQTFVWGRRDMVGLDAAILMHPEVWRASGHVENFTDPLVDCRSCRQRFRADNLEGDACPNCGETGTFTEPRQFNLMFETHVGPVQSDENRVHLRPETAQGIFVNFDNVLNTTRRKLPFGIAQIGKTFRNEITTGNFIFRTREFEIMEIEFFVKPGDDEEWHQKWIDDCMAWYTGLGVDPDRLRLRPHESDELAHYAKATYDIEYLYPWGWGEIQGIANRTDFDLKAHSDASGESLTYFDEQAKERYTPYVIEPSAGVDSALNERPRPGQKRKLNGRQEAHLIAIACSDAPEGHADWTIQLLADKVVAMGFAESISLETVRQILKKTNSSRGRRRSGASPR